MALGQDPISPAPNPWHGPAHTPPTAPTPTATPQALPWLFNHQFISAPATGQEPLRRGFCLRALKRHSASSSVDATAAATRHLREAELGPVPQTSPVRVATSSPSLLENVVKEMVVSRELVRGCEGGPGQLHCLHPAKDAPQGWRQGAESSQRKDITKTVWPKRSCNASNPTQPALNAAMLGWSCMAARGHLKRRRYASTRRSN